MAKKKAKTSTKKKSSKAKVAAMHTTTAQQLASIIKSARDVMRKDRGLNGDLDRLPLLTWVMFLKFLDDREKLEEARAAIAGKKYKPAIASPYRWRDWAADPAGITGNELIAFVNQEEAVLPDGKPGAGLFAYLRGLRSSNGDRRRAVIATVFEGVTNRMLSGYLLRDVVNLVDKIHFDSSDEIHTLSRLYESMLREMRDAAGDSGEFYTPRPVIQFMVDVTDPKLGEIILDPACGTGGFLAETFTHLEKQCKTVRDRETLQTTSILGGEAKPLPYMLAQMNLLLHGLNAPAIEYGNSLAVKLSELGTKDQVDVILTNPPFGGEEEAGIRDNFPPDKQASETALLFLQLIVRRLRKTGNRIKPGRAAIIVPNTTLFYSGVAAKIRAELIKDYGLTCVVRLPKGVFEPYTDIETNILFLDPSRSDGRVLYYRLLPPDSRKQYTKTQPLHIEELRECAQLIQVRSDDSSHAWFEDAGDLAADPLANLDKHNPKDKPLLTEAPDLLCSALSGALGKTVNRVSTVAEMLGRTIELTGNRDGWLPLRLGDALTRRKDAIEIADGETYKRITIRVRGRGIVVRDEVDGSQIGTKRQFLIESGQFALSKIDARNGAFGIVPNECDGAIITGNFWAYDLNRELLHDRLLHHFTQSAVFLAFCIRCSPGATNRRYLQEDQFLDQVILVPSSLEEQIEISKCLDSIRDEIESIESAAMAIAKQAPQVMNSTLHTLFPTQFSDEEIQEIALATSNNEG